MRTVPRPLAAPPVEEGDVIHGYLVERQAGGHVDTELRYAARSRGGTPATLVTSRWRHPDRRDRIRFRRLAARRRALDHSALIHLRAVAERDDHPVLILDPYPEHTFGDLLTEEAPLAPDQVVDLLTPVATALDLAHRRGLVHQSLSSESILVASGERLLLDSFGLAVPRDWRTYRAGDVRYRSPEQLRGLTPDRASNVYSLTALIVHALTGAPPYDVTPAALAYSHLVDPAPSVSARVPELGTAVDAVVERGMAKDPEARPKSAGELVQMLSVALGTEPQLEAAPTKGTKRRRRGRRRAEAAAGPVEKRRLLGRPRRDAARRAGEKPRRRGRRRAEATAGTGQKRRLLVRRRREAVPGGAEKPQRRGRGRLIMAVGAIVVAAICGAVAAAALDPFAGGGTDSASSPPARTWERLAEARVELRNDLAAAKTPKAQATAADDLAAAYRAAARTPRPQGLASAAAAAAKAYADLAAAARSGDAASYAAAAGAVAAAERRVSAASAGQ